MSLDFSANFVYTGTSQIWNKPLNVSTVYFVMNGGGGGGGSNSSSIGGSGANVLSIFNYLHSDQSFNVVINVGSGGQSLPSQTGGISSGSYIDSSGNSRSNGGDGTTLSSLSSGGGGGMTSIFYFDASDNEIIKIIAGGGGGGGSINNSSGGSSGNIGILINNNSATSSLGSNGAGSGGGQGGNTNLFGNAGLGGTIGGVNGQDFVDSSGTYYYYGGGGGSGGSFAGGGGGAGYGGAAGGKYGGGGGGGSYSNGNTTQYTLGGGGVGGGSGMNGGDGSVTIFYYFVPPVIPDSQVKMFMLNPQHTCLSNYVAPLYKPLIVNSIPFSIIGVQNPNAAVIGPDGEIYIVGGNGALYAYYHNFTLKWTTPFSITNYPFFGTPAIRADGTLYVSTTTTLADKYFYAVLDNTQQGGVKWSVPYKLDANDGNISTSPVLDASNNIYFGTDKGVVYALSDNVNQGITAWQYPSNGSGGSAPDGSSVMGTPALDLSYNTMCYTTYNTTTQQSAIYALDLSRNNIVNKIVPTQRWVQTISNDFYTVPSIENKTVYVPTNNGTVHAYDISSNGNPIWPTTAINLSDTNLSAIAVGPDNYLYLTSQKALNVIDSSNGLLVWAYPIDPSGASVSNNSTPIIDANNNVFFGARNSYLYSVNGAQRNFNWRYKVGGAIQGMPVIGSKNNIYLGANDALIYDFSGNSPATPTSLPIVPMYMLNVKHTNLSSYYGPTTAIIPSIYRTADFVSGNLFVSPAVSIAFDGTLYLGSNDGYVYSFTPNLSLNWHVRVNNTNRAPFTSPNSIYTTPVIGPDGTIYIGSNEGYLIALNPINGAIKWKYNAGYPLQSSPILDVSHGTLYFGAGNNVYAVGDAGDQGYPKWLTPFATNAHVNSSPALGPNGYLYFGSDDGYVYAVDGFTGLSVCSPYNTNTNLLLPPGNPIYTSASVDISGNVIIGNGSYMNGVLYYLDGFTLAPIWIKTTDYYSTKRGPFYNTVAIHGDTIYLSTIAYVYALDRITGNTKWHYNNTNCYYTSVALDASGTLYFGSIKAKTINEYTVNAGVLHCLTDNGSSFHENWALQVCNPGRLAPPVIGTNQTIYISATANKIYAIK
jgi:outer membrane protein assembly factor BamB